MTRTSTARSNPASRAAAARLRLLAACGVTLLALAACGGDGGSNPTTSPPPPPPPPPAAPVIVTPPLAQSVTAGASATFTVSATGDALSYQWQRGDAAINAATPSFSTRHRERR